MATKTRRPERREEPLTRERIVGAAIALLDEAGVTGLTFRALAERLATGSGAIYWYISGKDELLAAASEAVIGDSTQAAAPVHGTAPAAAPGEAVRALALALFDAIDAHPWLGTQLAINPVRSPMLRFFESLGRQVRALGVPPSAEFTAASALLNYILGVAGQNAANARAVQADTIRSEFLGLVASVWADLDPDEYAFTRSAADRLRDHDDRAEFLAGLDLILAGIITRLVPPAR
jgi:AcrR family transcriptional regulator